MSKLSINPFFTKAGAVFTFVCGGVVGAIVTIGVIVLSATNQQVTVFSSQAPSVTRAKTGLTASFNATVKCPVPASGTKVIVAFGQSNSANFGGINWYEPFWGTAHHEAFPEAVVLDWRDGNCYRLNDPVRGAEGEGASIWSRFADKLLEKRLAESVVVVSFGVGDTTIGDWVDGLPYKRGGEILANRLPTVAEVLHKSGYKADFIAYQQGESERNTDKSIYRAKLDILAERVKHVLGRELTASISTMCHGPANPVVTSAIKEAAEAGPHVRLGPDTDLEVAHALDRMDRCHLSAVGLTKAATLWTETFANR